MIAAWIIAGALWIFALGFLLGLCRAAALGDRVRVEPPRTVSRDRRAA